ncbi:hypothetical protein AC249_AIPGENE6578 [Exaiptasia diaphana]|nr:hypothetical protein AC249_AIPGENE6578 [Exaiptasia diaphana]
MIWNPTDRLVDGVGTPLMGGVHSVWIMGYQAKTTNNYVLGHDYPAYIPTQGENDATNQLYQDFLEIEQNNSTTKRNVYGSLAWVGYPMANAGYTIDPESLPTDVKIRVRMSKEYKDMVATGYNSGRPMYTWNMNTIITVVGSQDQLADALKLINIVPNPYRAYSQYERNRLDNRVKITNLPENCTIRIYNIQGKLIKTFKKSSPVTFIDWRLTNEKRIPIASGTYLVHVEVPGVGERVLKAFIAMRQVDIQNL